VSGLGVTLKPVRPLFGGYALVAFACAWLAGDWLAGQGPLEGLAPPLWLAVGAVGLTLAIGAALGGRRYGLSRRWRRASRITLAAGALLLWLGLGAARASAADPMRDPLSIARYADGATVQAQGQVIAEPDERAGYRFLTVRVASITSSDGQAHPAAGDVEATVYGPDDWFAPAYGDTVTLTGALQPLDGAYAPAGVVARMPSARVRIQVRGGGSPLLATLYQWRVALAQAIERTLPEPEAALLIGILLGLKSPALRARLPLFVATGTIHLVVPAGLKVSVLAEMASRAARRLGPWPRTVAALAAVGAYAAVGGGGPAAVRAAIMGTLLALAPALGRSYNVYTALALAALVMTGIEPALIADAGFQLTVLATFALPLLTPGIQAALLRLAGPLGKSQVAEPITESLAVTLAAEVATIPVVALTFHVVSLVAPLANLLTVPLLAPLLLLGGALAAVAALGWAPVALGLAWIVWPPLAWVNGVIGWTAGLPLAALSIQLAPVALAPLYYLALGGAIGGLWLWLRAPRASSGGGMARHGRASLGRRGALIALGLSLLASLGASAPAVASGSRAHLDFLDVGPGGAAILLREPGGFTALLDGGPNGPALESALAARLPFWSRSLDLVVLTGARAGETRGLDDAADHYHITSAVDAGMAHPTAEYLAYLDAMRRAGAVRQQARAGDVLHLADGATLTALAPPQTLYPPNEGDTTASNDLILRLDTPGLSALFLGASDDYALDALAGSGEPLAADVVALSLPRGAALDLTGPLGAVLRAAHPHVIVICDSPAPALKGFPAVVAAMGPSDEQAAEALGSRVYRISDDGAVALSGGADGWTLG
jgi:competence protein ComEC